MKVAVSGASGFIGRQVCATLGSVGVKPIPLSRDLLKNAPSATRSSDTPSRELIQVLEGCCAVIHLAGLAHSNRHGWSELQEINVTATNRLARACIEAGLPRFVFLSSLSVHGPVRSERIGPNTSIRPISEYGKSKAIAEETLEKLSSGRGLDVLALRAPLVCGRGAPGNLALLKRALNLGLPLPSADWNRRDLVGLRNLSDLLVKSLTFSGRGFLATPVCDGAPVSTTTILRCMAQGANKRARIVPVSPKQLGVLSALPLLGPVLNKMCSSLEVDASLAFRLFEFTPRWSTECELLKTGCAVGNLNL
jgi:UDP-glucose 4-epimerase